MNMRAQARRRGSLATLAVGLLVAFGPASASVADPTNPTDSELRQARSAVAAGAGAVADIEVQLAQQSAARDAAYAAAATAGEVYLRADQARQDAAAAATEAATQLDAANASMETSRRTLVAIALQAARSGGQLEGVQAFLSADGFDDVVERSAALSRMGVKADRAVQEFRATKIVADELSARAERSAAKQTKTAQSAKDTLAAANTAQDDAEAAIAAVTAKRETLIVELAAARSTTAEIERARQDQLDAERAARASATAQAARQAPSAGTPVASTPATPAPPVPSSSTPPGSEPAVSAPPVVAPPVVAPPVVAPPVVTPTTPTGHSRGSAGQGEAAAAWISSQLGLDYVWGATGPSSYDCSGLTQAAWRQAGLSINRTSSSQYAAALKISYDDLRPGDLVFWGDDPADPTSVYHVAMWIGGGQIAEASRPGVPTRITSMRWTNSMQYAGRP